MNPSKYKSVAIDMATYNRLNELACKISGVPQVKLSMASVTRIAVNHLYNTQNNIIKFNKYPRGVFSDTQTRG